MRFFVFSNLFLAGVFLAMMVDRLAGVGPVGDASAWMLAASALVGAGIVGVVVVERGPTMRAGGVSAARHAFEVGITVVFAVVILAVSWQMVVG
jgi:hypothetical protein